MTNYQKCEPYIKCKEQGTRKQSFRIQQKEGGNMDKKARQNNNTSDRGG